MKVTKENLLKSGYTLFKPSALDTCKEIYQKPIYRNTKLYYLNIKWYDFSMYQGHPTGEAWDSDVQFHLNGDETVQVDFFVTGATIERVEEFYLEFFDKFNCKPYDD